MERATVIESYFHFKIMLSMQLPHIKVWALKTLHYHIYYLNHK